MPGKRNYNGRKHGGNTQHNNNSPAGGIVNCGRNGHADSASTTQQPQSNNFSRLQNQGRSSYQNNESNNHHTQGADTGHNSQRSTTAAASQSHQQQPFFQIQNRGHHAYKDQQATRQNTTAQHLTASQRYHQRQDNADRLLSSRDSDVQKQGKDEFEAALRERQAEDARQNARRGGVADKNHQDYTTSMEFSPKRAHIPTIGDALNQALAKGMTASKGKKGQRR